MQCPSFVPRPLRATGLAIAIAALNVAPLLAADTTLNPLDLSACLIAGGVSNAEVLAKERRQIAAAIDGVLAHGPLTGTDAERAVELLNRLHVAVLTGRYDKGATDLTRVMATGDFNCLSASVLFGAACERANIAFEYWSQPGHVYCVLANSGLRIEPAARQWGPSTKAPARGTPARRLAPDQLVGKFYYNRGVEQLQQREFEGGIASLRRAIQLDPLDGDARANLLAGLNNWALALAEQDQPAAAMALISRGLAIDPHYAPLIANQRYLAERVAVP